MSRGNRPHRLLAFAAGAALMNIGALPSRGDQVVNRFDTAAEAAQWRFEFGNVAHDMSWDPTTDAGFDPNSGSLKTTFTFDATLGGDNKGAITRDLGSANGIDATKFSGMSFDVMIDPNSAKDAFGANGFGTMAMRNGPNWDWEPQFNDNLSASAGWRHVSVPALTGTINAVHALTFQIYGGPSQNITGPVTFWIDNVVLTQNMIPGDANLDGTVNFTDLLTLAQNYNLSPNAMWGQGDFNGDGSVNFSDLLILAQNYGSTGGTVAGAQAVPEPCEGALVALAGLGMLRRRK